jgi:crotonobetainyl-CoA:carnitine CoA-transferase CaiB-like acyl-CoA transferase
VRRGITGEGGLVQVSLMESILDVQFEVLTTYLNDGRQLPQRSTINNAHAYLAAPYGIYETADGYLALAMGSVPVLGNLLDCPPLTEYTDKATWFTQRDEIKGILADHLKTETTQYWLDILEPQDIWCADVLNWDRMFAHEGFQSLDMVQEVARDENVKLETLRCPIRIDGERLFSSKGAPRIGQQTEQIAAEFNLA